MPLEVVSDRMYDAAELNDNDKDESLSALSEIAALQDSYNNLRKKLNEMKAFVPQTVLQCEDEEDGSTDSGSKEKGKQPNDARSHRSRKESSAGDTTSTSRPWPKRHCVFSEKRRRGALRQRSPIPFHPQPSQHQ